LKKHLPFARIAKHSALWAPPLSGALCIYTRAYTENIFVLSSFALCLLFDIRFSIATVVEIAKDKTSMDPALAGFYEAIERTNVEKITDDMLVVLSRDSSDNESFDVESENEDAEKIGYGGQVMLFSGNPLLSKGNLSDEGHIFL
jgi:hypothetical protein